MDKQHGRMLLTRTRLARLQQRRFDVSVVKTLSSQKPRVASHR